MNRKSFVVVCIFAFLGLSFLFPQDAHAGWLNVSTTSCNANGATTCPVGVSWADGSWDFTWTDVGLTSGGYVGILSYNGSPPGRPYDYSGSTTWGAPCGDYIFYMSNQWQGTPGPYGYGSYNLSPAVHVYNCNTPPNTPYRWGTDIGYNAWTNSSSLQMGMIGTDPDSNMSNLYYQINYYNPNNNTWNGYVYNYASNLGYFANYGSSIYSYTTFGFPDGVYSYGAYGVDTWSKWSGFGGYYYNNYRDGTAPGSWTNLTNGGTYLGTVNVTVTGLDRWNPYGWGENYDGSWPYHSGSGLSCLYLAIDGAQWSGSWCGVGDNGSRSYSWNTTGVANGSHHIQTYATDNAGNGRWWEDKWVTVYNNAPPRHSLSLGNGRWLQCLDKFLFVADGYDWHRPEQQHEQSLLSNSILQSQ